MCFLLLFLSCRHGCHAIANENERKKHEDLDLRSVHHKSATVKTELDWLSKPRPMALLHKESFV